MEMADSLTTGQKPRKHRKQSPEVQTLTASDIVSRAPNLSEEKRKASWIWIFSQHLVSPGRGAGVVPEQAVRAAVDLQLFEQLGSNYLGVRTQSVGP